MKFKKIISIFKYRYNVYHYALLIRIAINTMGYTKKNSAYMTFPGLDRDTTLASLFQYQNIDIPISIYPNNLFSNKKIRMQALPSAALGVFHPSLPCGRTGAPFILIPLLHFLL